MSFNFSELQQKADRVIHNADEFIRKYLSFFVAPANDTVVEYYDQQGDLKTVAIPNRAKLVQNFIANVSNAMQKIFYVDAVNGDDGNDGSESIPFKTLKKAIDSVPSGGYGIINLKSDVTVDSDIEIRNKYIRIHANNHKIIQGITGDNANTFILRNSTLIFKDATIETASSSNTDPNHTALISGLNSWYAGVVSIGFINCIININTQHVIEMLGWGADSFTQSVYLFKSNIQKNGNGLFWIIRNTGILSVADTNTIKDNSGNNLHWTDILGGIVRDSNGNPRNIISNIVL